MSYERQMILDSIKANGDIDPNTKKKIGGDPMVPNKALKVAVQDFLRTTNYLDDPVDAEDYKLIKF